MKNIFFILSMTLLMFVAQNVSAAPLDDFVITVKTDNPGPSADTEFTIPIIKSGGPYDFSYNVDCNNDGTDEATDVNGNYTCDYSTLGGAGTYTVRIKDNAGDGTGFSRIYFNDTGDKNKLLAIEQWGTGSWVNMARAFDGCSNLVGHATDAPDLSRVTELTAMFRGATAFDQNIGSWDVSTITDMTAMFRGVTLSTANYDALLNGWNGQTLQSSVVFDGGNSTYCEGGISRTNMILSDLWTITDGGRDCSYQDFVVRVQTDNPGTSSDTEFTISTFPGEVYDYNVDCNNDGTDEVTAQSGDYTCSYITAGTYTVRVKDNTGSVTGFPRIYFNNTGDSSKLLAIEQWGAGHWTSMESAFAGCNNLVGYANDTPDLSGVTDMSNMFQNATAFNQDISSWDTSSVTKMDAMFYEATAFDQNIGSWDVSQVQDMTTMFTGVTLSTANYDALLNGWNGQILQSGVVFDGGNSKYCAGEAARANMISSDLWTITDGGKDCPPVLTETTPVPTPTNDTTPDYTFNTDKAGTITYGGSCSSTTTAATSGDNTITFDTLAEGTYSDCTITVTDTAGDGSTPLAVTPFTIDTTNPSVTLTPITKLSNASITDTTIRVTDTVAITAASIDASSSSAAISSLDCTQTSSTEVNCTISIDASGDLTVSATDDAGNVAGATETGYVIDVTAPTLTETTPVPTPANDTTPDYTFNTDEAGAITYGGSCSSTTTAATSGANTITFNTLAEGTYSDCTITVTDTAGNGSAPLAVTPFTIDTTVPTLTEITAVPTPANDTTPNYTFNTDEAGAITYGGSCSSATTAATSGANTITFNTLAEGTYSDCTITVTDTAGNGSIPLSVTPFTIDITAPTLTEVTPVPTPANDPTPDYTFNTDKAGTITYGGRCISVTTSAAVGDNTITFNTLAKDTYSDCTITVTDVTGNNSIPLNVTEFTITFPWPMFMPAITAMVPVQ